MPQNTTIMSPNRAQWSHIGYQLAHERRQKNSEPDTEEQTPKAPEIKQQAPKPMAVKTPSAEVRYQRYPEPTD